MYNETLTYNKNLHMDPGTKKLILGLLNNLLSVVPADRSTGPDTTLQDAVHERDKDRYIEETLLNAHEHAGQLEGIIDPGELERYYGYLKDYREISRKMEELLAAVNSYRDTACQFSYKLAELLEEHIDMVTPPAIPRIRGKDPGTGGEGPRLRVV